MKACSDEIFRATRPHVKRRIFSREHARTGFHASLLVGGEFFFPRQPQCESLSNPHLDIMHVSLCNSTPKRLLHHLVSLNFLLRYSTTPLKSNLISYYFFLLHSSPTFKNLRHLHAQLLRNGLYDNVILSSKLILMYSKHHNLLPYAYSVFTHMPNRNIYSWNIMIGEFLRSDHAQRSIDLFVEMRGLSELGPDVFTLPLVLRACASLGDLRRARCLHGFCVKVRLESEIFVASAIVFSYVSGSSTVDARRVFDESPRRDAVLWTAMLGGYAQNGEPKLGLEVYRGMVDQGVDLDGVVVVSLLLICSQLGWPRHGRSVHGWSVRRCLGLGLSLGNAILDMHVKCGELERAHKVFDRMPERDVISWSTMISGYGLNGYVLIALELFYWMRVEGAMPNSVTFLGILSACCHAGMVDEAWDYFNMMKDCNVIPDLKHYTCMVDVLGRAGRLAEAEKFIEEIPMELDDAAWLALLGGCRVHGNVEVGERVAKRLIGLEPQKSGYYVLLANIYAAAGKFDDAERVRRFMKERNVGKVPGWSLIEADGWVPSS